MSTPTSSASGAARLEKADSVIKAWTRFNGIYKAKRYIIENRWIKMRNDRKKKLLGDTWPGMPDDHRPDLNGPAVWRLKGQKALAMPWPLVNEPEISHMLLPDFNKEDLGGNDVALLQVLESRANTQPGDFGRLDANYDIFNRGMRNHYRVRTWFPSKWSDRLRGISIVYAGPVAEDSYMEYGAICQLEGEEHLRALQSSNYVKFEEGNRVMDHQEKIYNFLERVCRNLTDESKNKAFSAKGETNQTVWRRTPIFDPQTDEQAESLRLYLEDWNKLVHFSTPCEVDWDYVSVLSGSRLRSAQQALRNLKEDPEAFFLALQDSREHSKEVLLSYPNNQRHPWLGVDNNPEAWATAFKFLFAHMAWSCDYWQCIFTHTEKLRQMANNSELTQQELIRGSEDFRAHFLAIACNLTFASLQFSRTTGRLICSENMRSLYRVENGKIVQGLGTRKPSNDKERTVISIINAIEHDKARYAFGSFTLLDEMRRRIQSPWMSNYAMAILDEINDARLLFAHVYRAWDSERHHLTVEDVNEPLLYDFWLNQALRVPSTSGTPLERVFHWIMMTTDSNGSQKLGSLRNKFRHTKKAKMSKAQRTNSIEAEANLKALWEYVERVLRDRNALSDDVKAVLADVEPLVTKSDSGAASTQASTRPVSAQSSNAPFIPIPAAQPGDLVARRVPRTLIDLQAEARQRVLSVDFKKKDGPVDAPVPEEGREWPKIMLRPDEYSTVEYLLGTSNEARPGEIDWNDIVRLLNAIGFTGPRRHPGSARSFAPGEDLRRDQGITETVGLHEPHQSRNMPLIVARDWARNRSYGLAKYGWDIDHFAQEGDEAPQAAAV